MSYILMLLLISMLVILHEFGHMIVAQRCGVKVERFGLGLPFGPTLFEKEWKGIKWCLHSVPLGGYVSFPDDNEDSDVPPDSPQRFENQPLLNQAAIAMAGITVNAIIAIVLMVFVLGVWGARKSQLVVTGFSPVVQEMSKELPPNTPLALYEQGQKMVLTGLTPIEVSREFQGYITGHPQSVMVAVDGHPETPLLKILTSPAQDAGVQIGDVLLSAKTPDGQSSSSFEGYYSEPAQNLPQFLSTFAKDDVAPHTLILDVAEVSSLAQTTLVKEAGQPIEVTIPSERKLGIYMGLLQEEVPVDFLTNVRLSSSILGNMVAQNFIGLGKLVTGQISPQMLDGPVGVVKVGGELIQQAGIQSGLWLTAIISIILAVMNLLPFPPLDGSYLIYIGYEALFKRPFPVLFKQGMNMAGFVILMGLMLFVLGNDIVKLFS